MSLSGWQLGPHLAQCGVGRGLLPYQVASYLDPSSRLATADMGRKLGCAPFWDAETHLTQCAWAQAYLRTKWHVDPPSRLATIGMGAKVGSSCAPFWGSWVAM